MIRIFSQLYKAPFSWDSQGTYKLGNGVRRLCCGVVPDGICCRFMRRKTDVVSGAKVAARLLPRENATMRFHQFFKVIPANGPVENLENPDIQNGAFFCCEVNPTINYSNFINILC